MSRRLGIVAVLLIAGFGIGMTLPSWRVITITFPRGGRSWSVAGESPRLLPGTMDIDDDGRLRLRVINEDSVSHSAGVIAVSAGDSTIVSADLCTGTHRRGANTILLR
ncbi:MAG TPA: hypothetical protein VGI92_05850 [Gemmatimonadales bacterium]